MATVVKDYQFRTGAGKYKPEWLDGRVWALEVGEGKDVISHKAAEAALRKLAGTLNKRCQISYNEEEGKLYVKAFDADDSNAPKPRAARKKTGKK